MAEKKIDANKKKEVLAKMAEQLEVAKAAFAKAIALADESGVEFEFDLGVNFPHPYGEDYGNQGLGGTYHPEVVYEDGEKEPAYVYWDASSMNC